MGNRRAASRNFNAFEMIKSLFIIKQSRKQIHINDKEKGG